MRDAPNDGFHQSRTAPGTWVAQTPAVCLPRGFFLDILASRNILKEVVSRSYGKSFPKKAKDFLTQGGIHEKGVGGVM